MSNGRIHIPADFILRFSQGDKDAFEFVFDRFYDRMLFFARKFVVLEIAEDVLSEAFVRLWHRRANFQSLPEVEQWLHVSVRNACIDQLRRAKNAENHASEYFQVLEQFDQHTYLQSTIEAELFAKVLQEIDRLSGTTKKVIQLSFLQGLGVDQIAVQLNLTRQVVYNKKSQGLKELRLSLAGQEQAILNVLIAISLLGLFE